MDGVSSVYAINDERGACGAPSLCGAHEKWAQRRIAAEPERFAVAAVLIEAGQRDRSWATVAPDEALDLSLEAQGHPLRSSLPF